MQSSSGSTIHSCSNEVCASSIEPGPEGGQQKGYNLYDCTHKQRVGVEDDDGGAYEAEEQQISTFTQTSSSCGRNLIKSVALMYNLSVAEYGTREANDRFSMSAINQEEL